MNELGRAAIMRRSPPVALCAGCGLKTARPACTLPGIGPRTRDVGIWGACFSSAAL